ncbi:MAG TPA: hypothetical protein VGG03_01595 [Thermoanaerobaculia bacterium]|jgi:hypothetical protein
MRGNLRRLKERRFQEGFRETFLLLFTRKGDAAALRRVCLLLMEMYRNIAPGWWPYPKEGELKALILAALRDLRHVRDVLAWIDGPHGFVMEDAALASFVGRCADDLEKIAASIEDAMANPQRTLEEDRARVNALLYARPRPGEGVSS